MVAKTIIIREDYIIVREDYIIIAREDYIIVREDYYYYYYSRRLWGHPGGILGRSCGDPEGILGGSWGDLGGILGDPEGKPGDRGRRWLRGTNFGRSWELGKLRQDPFSASTVWGIRRSFGATTI